MSGVALGLELLQVAERLAAAYSRIRAIAAQNGVTDAQLEEADARFANRASDPLAGVPPAVDVPPKPVDPTVPLYTTMGDAIAAAKSAGVGYGVVEIDGGFRVWPKMLPGPGPQVWP